MCEGDRPLTVLRSGSASHVGRVRTVNEDLALQGDTLFAVADGMGGHAGGEVAAHTAIDALQREFGAHPTEDGLAGAVQQANLAVWERSLQDADLRGMGTTLVAAALVATDHGDRLVMANVGDSRSYRLRDGSLEQLSHDHSVAEELVDRGELSEAEAAIHPHRHILTRALGVAADVDADVWEMTPHQGDRYLLCSDGLTNEVPEARIAKVLSTTPDPQEAADTLVRMANDNGGNDNITVVVLDVMVGDDGAGRAGVGATSTDEDVFPAATAAAEAAAGAAVVAAASPAAGPRLLSAPAVTRPPAPPADSPAVTSTSSDPAEGMRAMSARADEVRHRLRSRRFTFRVLLFLIVLAAIVAGGFAVVRVYVDSSYFVKLHQGQVLIYQGRMGGFLGMTPKVVDRTGIPAAAVPISYQSAVQNGLEESSLRSARNYVCNLWQIESGLQGATQAPKPRFCR